MLVLARSSDNAWTVNDTPRLALDGCIDVDLGFSPSTNLLPIRRLRLAVGQRAAVRAAWVRFPELTLEVLEQTYTRLSESTYLYESAGVLGFSVARISDPPRRLWWPLLERGDARLMLNAAYEDNDRPSVPDPARVAAHLDAALFFGCPDVDEAYHQLRAQGIDAEEPFVQPYGMKQLYLKDPDGYSLCLQWPVAQ
jgi:uncharacterized glyoxalase superfamily protein PhnB